MSAHLPVGCIAFAAWSMEEYILNKAVAGVVVWLVTCIDKPAALSAL